jgi:hypothetical protein
MEASEGAGHQQKDSVKVAVNIRPLITEELRDGCTDCVIVTPGEPQVWTRLGDSALSMRSGCLGWKLGRKLGMPGSARAIMRPILVMCDICLGYLLVYFVVILQYSVNPVAAACFRYYKFHYASSIRVLNI